MTRQKVEFFFHGDELILVQDVRLDFDGANSFCNAIFGGHLVKIERLEEQDEVVVFVQSLEGNEVWIGVHDPDR